MKPKRRAAAFLSSLFLLALTACAEQGGVHLAFVPADSQTGSGISASDASGSAAAGVAVPGSAASSSAASGRASSGSARSSSTGAAGPTGRAQPRAAGDDGAADAQDGTDGTGKTGDGANLDEDSGTPQGTGSSEGQSDTPFSQNDALAAYNDAAARVQAGAVFDFSYTLQGGNGESGSGHAAVRAAGGPTFSTSRSFGSETLEFYTDGHTLWFNWTRSGHAYLTTQTYSDSKRTVYVPLFVPQLKESDVQSFSLADGSLQLACAPDASLFSHAQDFLAQAAELGAPAAVQMDCVVENGAFQSLEQTFTFSGGQTLSLRLDFSAAGADVPVGVPNYVK